MTPNVVPDVLPGGLLTLTILIGWTDWISQGLAAQESSVEILAIDPRDDVLRGRFADLFRADHETSWQNGWRLSRKLGATVVPLLAELWRNGTSNPGDRQLMISAVSLAAGVSGESFLLGILRDRDRALRERVMCHLCFALGGERPGTGTSVERLLGVTSRGLAEPVLAVSTCLALKQFLGSGQAPRSWYQHHDPGIAAAAQYSRPTSVPKRWLRKTRKHRELVLRGFLLGASSTANREAQGTLAVAQLGADVSSDKVSLAAALNLGRTGRDLELGTIFARPSLKGYLPALLEKPSLRQRLIRVGLLNSHPETRLGQERRARMALAYALEAEFETIGDDVAKWGRDGGIAGALCLGFAWRLNRDPQPWPSRYVESLPDIPEAEWVRLALGQDVMDHRTEFLDPVLHRAFRFAREGRLPREAMAIAIENALWRAGWHLGLTRREAEHDLIADLMFAGSEYGSSKLLLGPNARAYLPKGFPPRDVFFRIAYEFFAFMRLPGPRVIAAYRLR